MANDTNQRLLKTFPGARLFAVAPAVLLLAAACGGSDDTTPKLDEVCEPGKAAECRCPSGQLSSQQCAPDGLKWGDCQCTAGVGGTANGGSAGSAAGGSGGSAQGGAAGGGAGGNAGVGGAGAVSGNGGVGGSTAGSAGMGAGGTSAGSGGVGGTNTAGTSSGGSSGSAAGGTGGTGGSAAGGSSGTGGSGGSGPLCPGTHGPAMTKISSTLCVDNTEVTEGQYRDFLTAKTGDYTGQPTICNWNVDYGAPLDNYELNYPRTYVDYCDAAAYCKWAGKRACGAVGSVYLQTKTENPAATDELREVCLEAFNFDATSQCSSTTVHEVGSLPLCVGVPPNGSVSDIIGNVREWAGCWDPTKFSNPYRCDLVGGYLQAGLDSCDSLRRTESIKRLDGFTGFRCCADPN